MIKLVGAAAALWRPSNMRDTEVLPIGFLRLHLAARRTGGVEFLLERVEPAPLLLLDVLVRVRGKRKLRWTTYENGAAVAAPEAARMLDRLGFDGSVAGRLLQKSVVGRLVDPNGEALTVWLACTRLFAGAARQPGRSPKLLIYTRTGDEINVVDGVYLAENMAGGSSRLMFRWVDDSLGAYWWSDKRGSDYADFDAESLANAEKVLTSLGFTPGLLDAVFSKEIRAAGLG